MEYFLLAGALLVFASVLLTPLSARIGAPVLLFFLGLGMLVGEDGPAALAFDDFNLAYDLGSVVLAVILFAGGLDTKVKELRVAALPAGLLATLGVVLTAVVLGLFAAWVLALPLLQGLLLGALVASTDAAATFLMLHQGGVALKGRVKEVLLVESGLNDPMAIFLTITLTHFVDAGGDVSWEAAPEFLSVFLLQLGLGALAGLGGGWALAWVTNRIHLPVGLYAPFVLSGALAIFAATQLGGGSGFLAVYLCGIVLVDRLQRPPERVVHFHEGLSWLGQIVMFLMLGLLVDPSELGEDLLPALALALAMIFVARPLAALACLWPCAMPLRQQFYVGWVGLRGAVPIFLALIPVLSPGPVTGEFFNIVFVIVICSLTIQGWTLVPMARWLGVAETPATESKGAPPAERP